MGSFYLLFGLGLKMGGDNFLYFLLCGLLPWKWFSSSLSNGSLSIIANAGLINQIYLPKYVLPMVTVTVTSMKFLVVLPILLLFLILSGFTPSVHWTALPAIVASQFLLVAAIASLLAAIVPFVPDLRFIIENGMLLLMFLSGVFFDMARLDESLRAILYLNPMAVILKDYREVLLHNQWPSVFDISYIIGFAAVIGAISWHVLKRIDRRVIKVL
jgi:lipopolysaccharide transport system permease protein